MHTGTGTVFIRTYGKRCSCSVLKSKTEKKYYCRLQNEVRNKHQSIPDHPPNLLIRKIGQKFACLYFVPYAAFFSSQGCLRLPKKVAIAALCIIFVSSSKLCRDNTVHTHIIIDRSSIDNGHNENCPLPRSCTPTSPLPDHLLYESCNFHGCFLFIALSYC